jgi:hypothetical protein
MNIERYEFVIGESLIDFEFESDGPKGKIKKIVSFSPYNSDGKTYFNLAFGDLVEKTGKLNDTAISDNKDTLKILATIAGTVLEFTRQFPDIIVYAKGSSLARTRLYQMGISGNWNEIEPLMLIFGFVDGQWEPFKKNVNYEAFLAQRKNL